MPSSNTHYTDVLVIGAGPSGLMVAQALGRLGVQVKVVERREVGALYGHADGLQPRTLEIWRSYGMGDEIISKGAAVNAIVTYASTPDGTSLVRSEPTHNVVVQTRYPFELGVAINDIEGTLRSAVEGVGVSIEHETIPTSIEVLNGEYPVKVVVKRLRDTQSSSLSIQSQATSTICAKYVIGADGAYSWVRRNLGIPMEGDQTEYVWGVSDVLVETDFPDIRFKSVVQASAGTVIIIPRENDKLRLYVQLSKDDIPILSSDICNNSASSLPEYEAVVLGRATKCLHPYSIEYTKVFWTTIFSIGQRVASQFSYEDRVFIMGDACHTHSPKAAQGANASMGDAHNLAWKLAYVLRGWAKPSLLDTYEEERRKFAQDLIAFDKEISDAINKGSAADYQRMLHKQNIFTSGVGISYAHSPLTQLSKSNSAASNLRCGERLPPCPLVRLADWQPADIQDACPSDGLLKLYVFPGDIKHDAIRERLSEFSTSLEVSSGARGIVHERIRVYTVLNGDRRHAHWKEVPEYLANFTWKWSFIPPVPKLTAGNVYNDFGISALPTSHGAAVLVRPDGYISIIGELNKETATHIVEFVYSL
ncbi:FAD binding domain-containing protein [Cyathus striatus]|nr:FAD binding domain-containing protein [Cyathus striatus]